MLSLSAVAEDIWSSTDCNTLEVTTDAARWTCVWGDNVRLTTWDVPLRLFETITDMQETTHLTIRTTPHAHPHHVCP